MNTVTIESRGTTALRTTTILVGGYLAVSVLTLVAIVLLRNDPAIVNIAVWIRGCFAAASAAVLLALAIRTQRGSAPAYLRVRIISAVIVVAIAVIILLPGTFPLWMKIEQGVCELLLIGVVVIANRRQRPRRVRGAIDVQPGGSVPVMYENSGMPGNARAGDLQLWARGWRRLGLACGMLVYPLITAATIQEYSSGVAAIVAYAVVATFCVCYLFAMVAVARFARRSFWLLLGIMTLLFAAALPLTQVSAFYLCAVILSLATITLRRRVAPFVAAAAIASLVVPVLVPSWRGGPGWTQAIMIVFTVLLVYAFAEIARTNRTLVEARAEVAELAADAERNRIARDLHDLVGHSLTAITVKSNLARQLAGDEDSPSLREIAEIEILSRQALADVRAAVSGYREVTLAGELARGRELLRAAGVTADLPTAVEHVDAAHQELFGWIIREGITNVVRHARATRCTVTVSNSAVDIRDDGVGGAASWGHGIIGVRERVETLGGSVEAGQLSPHGWRLRVSFGDAATA